MRQTNERNKQGKALLLAALLAASALGLAGCAKGEDASETMSSGIQEESAAQDESAPEGEQLGSEVIGRGAAFGLGQLEEMPEAFAQVVESNKEALKAYQEQAAKEAGVVSTASRTAFGHTIYAEPSRPSNVYIFSGTELVEAAVNANLNSPDCPLYHADKLYEVLGKAQGSLKTEDGVLIQEESAGWTKRADSTVQIEKVLINGEEIDTLAVGETWGTGEALRLRAFTGADTLADTKDRALPISAAFVVDGTQYTFLGNFGAGDLTVGFDGSESFVLLARSMLVPTSDGFAPDMNAYTALLAETYGAEFTAMQFTVDQPITVWNPQTGETEQMQAIATGEDGFLYLNVEALEAVTGMQVLLSADGKVANIITDPQYNAMAGGNDAGLNKTALNAREDVQRAANDYQVLVAMEKAYEEEERVRQEQWQKQLEEAARQQPQSQQNGGGGQSSTPDTSTPETSTPDTSSKPDTSTPDTSKPDTSSTPDTSTPGNTNREPVQEPTSGRAREMADRMNGVWDQELEGWIYTDFGGDRVLIRYSGGSEILYD